MEKTGFIFVNLLPYREKIKVLQIRKFAGLMFAFALAGGVVVGIGHMVLSLQMETQDARNKFIMTENKKLDEDIKSIATLKEEIKITLEKRKVVEALQLNRADGVNIINQVANNLPDDSNLKSIKKIGDKLWIVGQTSSNNKVSHYMTSLAESSVFSSPTLLEIKSVVLVNPGSKNSKNAPKEELTVNEFSLTVEMAKSEEELLRIAEEKNAADHAARSKAARSKAAK